MGSGGSCSGARSARAEVPLALVAPMDDVEPSAHQAVRDHACSRRSGAPLHTVRLDAASMGKGMTKRAEAPAVADSNWWTEEQLVAHLGVNQAKLRHYLYHADLPFHRVGTARYYDPREIDAWLAVRSIPTPRKRRTR